jgi:hypothetical protein
VWNGKGGLETGAIASSQNYFQGRYAIRHGWTGAVKCAAPQRGRWGGPPDGAMQQTLAANKTAFAPRGKIALGSMIGRDLTEIGVKRTAPPSGGGTFAKPPGGGKAMFLGFLGGLALIGAGLFARRRS